jgi:hypothetical protein
MKNILIATFLTACVLQSSAQLAIYKARLRGTETGAGATLKWSGTGYVLYDVQTGALGRVAVFPAKKYFFTEPLSPFVQTVKGANGKNFMAWILSTNYFDGNGNLNTDAFCIKGPTQIVNISLTGFETSEIPKSMSVIERGVDRDPSTQLPLVGETSGSLVLDFKTTQNYQAFALDEAMRLIALDLVGQGYAQKRKRIDPP